MSVRPLAEHRGSIHARPVNVESLVEDIPFLPPAFELVPRLLLLLDDPDSDCEALAEVIRVDPGLTLDVLQMANCAYLTKYLRHQEERFGPARYNGS